MNKIKIILSYLFGFILSLGIFLLAILFISKKTICDKTFMFRLMDENNYYEKVYNSINEDVEDYMMSSGLETVILNNVIVKSTVKSEIINYVNYLYEGKKYNVDTTYIHDTLKTNIDNYLKGLNLGIDNTNELELFIGDIEGIYKEEVSFYNTIDRLASYLKKLPNILNKALIIDIILVGVLLILLLLIRVVNIGSCIFSSGLILFLIKIFIYERIDSQNILIVSDHFSLIVRNTFKYISNYMISISVILLSVGFILCLFDLSKKND